MSWIVIPNWGKFQHYGDRRAPWLKDYVDQLDRNEYLELAATPRALLYDLRKLYLRRSGQVTFSTAWLSKMTGLRVKHEHIEALQTAGFVDIVASKPLALARTRARAREQRTDLPKKVSKQKPAGGKVTGWRMVRGSHGITHIPDPAGTDRPPF